MQRVKVEVSRTDEICPRDRHVKFKNNTSGRERLWDTALKILCPDLFITSPDRLAVPVTTSVIRAQFPLGQVLLEPRSHFGKHVRQRRPTSSTCR